MSVVSVRVLLGKDYAKGRSLVRRSPTECVCVCVRVCVCGVVVKALRYKPAGRGFDSRWCHWNFSVTSFRSHYGPGVDTASNRNEYQVYFLGVKAAGA
jgi:hypothetical protein